MLGTEEMLNNYFAGCCKEENKTCVKKGPTHNRFFKSVPSLILAKGQKQFNGVKIAFSTNDAKVIGQP